MVRLHGLPLLLNVISLAGRSDAKQHGARGLARESSDSQPLSLYIRDGLANGADPVELYESIKVARAEAAANGRTIDVPEEDLRAILDQIEDLHNEVDALMSNSPGKAEQEVGNGNTNSNAGSNDSSNSNNPTAGGDAASQASSSAGEPETTTSDDEKVSDPGSSSNADSILDSVNIKQKAPVAALDDEESSSAGPLSTVASDPTSADPASTVSASGPSVSSEAETSTEMPMTSSTPVVTSAISTAAEDEEATITTTITSTTTVTITLTEVSHRSTSTPGFSDSAAAATPAVTPGDPIVNIKAVDNSEDETNQPTSTTAGEAATGTASEASSSTAVSEASSQATSAATLASSDVSEAVASSSLMDAQVKAAVSSADKASTSTEIPEPSSTATELPSDLTSAPISASSDVPTTSANSASVDPAVKVIVTSTVEGNSTLTGFRTMVRV